MATDNSPPRLKLIVTIAIITIVTLVSLNVVLTSYYGYMSDEATRSKLAPTQEKYDQQKHEKDALSGIEKAMKDVGAGTRTTAVEPSTDLAPMIGWSKLPKAAPVPGQMNKPATGTTMITPDGGAPAPMASDAGVAPDAAAPAPAPRAPQH